MPVRISPAHDRRKQSVAIRANHFQIEPQSIRGSSNWQIRRGITTSTFKTQKSNGGTHQPCRHADNNPQARQRIPFLKLMCGVPDQAYLLSSPVVNRRNILPPRHRINPPDRPRHGEDRRRRVALLAVGAVAAAVNMVFADVVFAGKGVFKVACAFVKWRPLRAATLTFVHTGSHISLAFHYAASVPRKWDQQRTKVILI